MRLPEATRCPPLDAVLFDMDGVLVESFEAWGLLLDDAVAHFGGRPVPPGRFREIFGQSTADDCREFLPQVSPAELDGFYRQRFASRADRVRLLPGAAEALSWVRGRGLRTGCVTNAPSEVARGILAAAGLLEPLETLVGADQVAAAKPAPDLIFEACRRLGVAPERSALVGDSRFDVEAARAAGSWPISVGDQVRGDLSLATIADLPAALAGLLA